MTEAVEVAASVASYLATGGKVTVLPGFERVAPLPERCEPVLAGDTVDRKYIVRMLGVSMNSCFSATAAHRHLLPKPVGRNESGGFVYDKAMVIAAVAAIRAARAERDSEGRVDREYFVERLGMSYATLFKTTSIWDRHLPAPLDSSHLGTGRKCWYDKREADKAIRKIKKLFGTDMRFGDDTTPRH